MERCLSLSCTSKKPTGGSNSCGLCSVSNLPHLTFSLLQAMVHAGSEPCAGGKWLSRQRRQHHLASEWTGDAVRDAPSLPPATSLQRHNQSLRASLRSVCTQR